MIKGFLLTFEGIDGCGKSLQIEKISDKLNDLGINHLLLREPGGTDISEKIRFFILDRENKGMLPRTELFLYEAARAQIVDEIILPALEKDKLVLCDRFYDSSTAYQGYGRKIDIHGIKEINMFATLGIEPNQTFYFDVPVEIALKRKAEEIGYIPDRLESENKEFFEKARRGFLQIAKNERNRFILIDSNRDPEIIHQEVWELFCSRYEIFRGIKLRR